MVSRHTFTYSVFIPLKLSKTISIIAKFLINSNLFVKKFENIHYQKNNVAKMTTLLMVNMNEWFCLTTFFNNERFWSVDGSNAYLDVYITR